MLRRFAGFEIRYQLLSPLFIITALAFLVITFFMAAVPDALAALSGSANANSPFVIGLLTLTMSVYGVFIPTAFLSSAILRDRHFNTEPLFLTRPVSRTDYLGGRFIGAFIVCLLAFSVVPLAMFAAAFAPWLEAEQLGPVRPLHYLHAMFVLGAPNLLITGAMMFTVANLTRSTLLTYTALLVFIGINSIGGVLASEPGFRIPIAILDPFGYNAFMEVTRYWTPSELDTRLIPLSGLFLWNRLLWIAVAIALLVFNYAWFSFERRGVRVRLPGLRRRGASEALVPAQAGFDFARVTPRSGARAQLAQFLLRTRFEVMSLVRGVSVWVLMAFGVLFVVVLLFNMNLMYGTPVYPLTRVVMGIAGQIFGLIPTIVLIYFSAELVWRDRVRGAHELIDATSTPSWVFVFSKILAMWLVIAGLSAVAMLTGMAVQAVRGFAGEIDFGLYAFQMLVIGPYGLYLVATLAIFLQVLANNRYVGMLLMVGYMVSRIAMGMLGFSHNLYSFGAAPGAPYSDLNGYGHFLLGRFWLELYWTLFAAILMILTFALWNRGTLTPIWRRVAALPHRLRGATGAALAVLVVAFAATGAFVFYNTNIVNPYFTSRDLRQLSQTYEERYRQFEDAPQPKLTGVTIEVDIFPRDRRFEGRGTYTLENTTGAPIDRLYLDYDYALDVLEQELEDGRIVEEDDEFNFYILAFDRPLQPGETRTLRFEVARGWEGFTSGGNTSFVLWNGTFFNNMQSMPRIGFNQAKMIQDPGQRRRRGLEPLERMAALEDEDAALSNYIGPHADWMDFEAVVSTAPDQIAIAPGSLVREWQADGRRYFHYRMETPILNFYAFLSARYEVAEAEHDGVLLQVFYDPQHDYNVDRMLETMGDAIAYFSEAFAPFQHSQMRIFEFPGVFGTFAQSFPNSVPYSEDAGFIADNRDPANIDYVYYITAHEVAHQWWAHQIISGNMQGATMLSETFSQYSSLMLMEKEYGEHHIRRFLKYELDQYLTGRTADSRGERPLYRVENQMYVHYNKGSLVMYALQDYLGEEVVNRALARLLDEHAYQSDPYPRSTDFLRILREEAGPEHGTLIADLFEKIILFDLKATDLDVTEREDGRFDVRLTVEATKLEAGEDGAETEIPLDYEIDIGLFARHPNEVTEGDEHVLLLEKRAITSGENVFEFTLDEAPAYGGIDPYNKLIDRVSGDNLISPSGDTGEGMVIPVPMQRS